MNLDYVDTICGWGADKVQQLVVEVKQLLLFLSQYEIKTYVEIGVLYGGTLAIFSEFLPEQSVLIGVDKEPKIQPFFWSKYPTKYQMMQVVTGDSHDIKTISKVKSSLEGHLTDLLFIDGNHFEVAQDFALWSEITKKGGFVVFHDINENGPLGNVGNVPHFWNYIKDKHESWEFNVKDPNGYGIGVIRYE
jgi:predicted O-methyltransferase YrrM